MQLELDRVVVRDNRGHGVLLNDQVDAPGLEDEEPGQRGSAASLQVRVSRSRFLRNGFSVSARDGLRVNEGGAGDLRFDAVEVWAEGNAADGIEIDERGDGSILGSVRHSTASDNYEEGFDFNENHAGDLRADFDHVVASGNGSLAAELRLIVADGNDDSGISVREDGSGSLDVTGEGTQTNGNSRGIDLDERADGNLTGSFTDGVATANGRGLRARQAPTGIGTLALTNVDTSGNTLANQLSGVSVSGGIIP